MQLIFGQKQLGHIGTLEVFKKGDLFKFNTEGMSLFRFITGSIGVISSDSKKVYEYDFHGSSEKTSYYTYDVLVCGQLFKDIPEKLLMRIIQNEENIK